MPTKPPAGRPVAAPAKPAGRPGALTRAPAAPRPSREQLTASARWALIGSALVTLAIYLTPWLQLLAFPLLYLSTMVHEMGHGVGAILSGGEWIEFRMFTDGSGYARSAREPGFASALTASAGLVGPALAAAVFMVLGLRARLARFGMGAAGLFFAFTLVFFVRGTFGVIYVAGVSATCLYIAIRATDSTNRIALLFFATQLALSVYSSGDYLFTDYVSGQMTGGKTSASDTQHMADAVGMTYWFWGIVCAAFSAAVLALAGWLYVRQPRRLDT